MANIYTATTIEELVRCGKRLELTHEKMSTKASVFNNNGDKIIINYAYLLDEYRDFFKEYEIKYNMSESQFVKYKYQPKMLSLDLYNTMELWSTILRLNNMTSITQFKRKDITLYSPDVLKLINEMFVLEEDMYMSNKNKNS